VKIDANATIATGVRFSDDGSNHRLVIGDGATLGENSVIFRCADIGARSVIRPAAVVERSVPVGAIVSGSPARITGYVGASAPKAELAAEPQQVGARPSAVRGVTIHRLPRVTDIRGTLSVGEFERTIPFAVKRYFMVYDVPSEETRGEHAHRRCHQFLICVRGSCSVVADDGTSREEFLLDRPDVGVYLPPMVWGIQYKYSADAVLLVFASEYYDSSDYIRDYSEFLRLAR
jgi:hypothetical protein